MGLAGRISASTGLSRTLLSPAPRSAGNRGSRWNTECVRRSNLFERTSLDIVLARTWSDEITRMKPPYSFRSKIAIIIPTMNRPRQLQRLLASLESQSALPDEVIIVDGSADPIDGVLKDFPNLNLRYLRVLPPCLSKQRNAGLAKVSRDMSLAGFLDDDLVLEPGSIEAMLRFWDQAPKDVGGASFNITNGRPPRGLLIKSLFRMDSFKRGCVMRSGYEASIPPVREDTYVDWLCGGATVWSREVVAEFKYDEWFRGYSYFEDVDYSYRVGRNYKLLVLANAKVQHLTPPVKGDRNFTMGKCQVINRRYFLQKHDHMSVLLFYWATLGLMIANIGEGILLRNPGLFVRSWGNFVGLVQSSFARLQQIDTALKD